MFEAAPEIVALLVVAAAFAGFVDSIAGGGGLVTLPALLLAGAPPAVAIGTNKVQGIWGAGAAALSYARGGQVDLRAQAPVALVAFGAAVAGALLVLVVPVDALRAALPAVLIGVALFFALKPGLGDLDRARRLSPAAFAALPVPLVAAYDGLLGPGAGAFYMIAFVALAGFGVLKATAHTKLLNFASNAGGLAVFALTGALWWKVGLAMAAGQVAGALVGSRLAMRMGAGLIRPLVVVTSLALAASLILRG
ncbi:MAG: TSUP family transporter [Hasllibacter sp.]